MRKIFFLLFVMVFTFGSCRKNFDVNQYANQPTDILSSFLLSAGLNQTAFNNANNYLGLTRWMGYWARSSDFPPDVQTETYDIKNSYTDSEWTRLYQNLSTYDLLEKTARELELPFYIGAAKVMKAYCFSTLADLYNDVPYKEAFGKTTRNQPAYDNAQDIYNDLVIQLDSAFIYFENARVYYQNRPAGIAIADDQYDIMFGSAKSKAAGYNERLTLWEKLTNTLELKLLVHQSQVGAQQSFIQNKINIINTLKERKAAGFIGAGESATVNPGYQKANGKTNPFVALFANIDGSFTENNDYYRANKYAYSFYRNGNDVRQGLFYDGLGSGWLYPCDFCDDTESFISGGGDTVIFYNVNLGPVIVVLNSDTVRSNDIGSIFDGDPAAVPSVLTDGSGGFGYGLIKDFNQDQFIFSDFESLFLQAEAKQQWPGLNLNGTAQELYESAITQNYIYMFKSEYNPKSEDAIESAGSYFVQGLPNIGWSASLNKLEAILTQKWAAMNGINWVEAYNDYRRTGYPTSNVLGISHAPTHLRPQIPTRFLYPQSQLNTNGANVPQLADGQYSKVFWDQ